MTQKVDEKPVGDIYKFANKDGEFKRAQSAFRSWISSAPGAEFPPEKDRYVRLLSHLSSPRFLISFIKVGQAEVEVETQAHSRCPA